MSAHTKGPWFANLKADGAFEITDMPDCWEAAVLASRYQWIEKAEECHANGVLMAAAPELLEMLCAMVLENDGGYVTLETSREARLAIAKATGEPA